MKKQQWLNQGSGLESESSFNLRLYITGASPNSTRAVVNLKSFCELHLKDNYQLEVIDVYQQPEIAQQEQIIALPLLVKKSPGPERRLVGDMSDTDKLLRSFNIVV